MAEEKKDEPSRSGKSSLSGMKPKGRSYTGDMEDLKKQIAGESSGEKDLAEDKPSGEEGGAEKPTAEAAGDAEESGASENGKGEEKKRLNFDVPESLHRRFKATAGMRGKTMTEVLTGLMNEYVEEAREEMF